MDEKMMAQFHAQMYMDFSQTARLCQEIANANYQMFMHHSGSGNMQMPGAGNMQILGVMDHDIMSIL